MLDNFRFHHIGYVTDSIDNTCKMYINTGYESTMVIEDTIQHVNICFLTKEGFPTIELIEPADEKSSVNKLLKKNGVSPYHICYEVEDINAAFEELIAAHGYTPLFRPVEAIALENRLISYLYHKSIGLIELVNKD